MKQLMEILDNTLKITNTKNSSKFLVIIMDGHFYELDEWFKIIEKKKEMSEGAKWWLGRIKEKCS